MKCSPSGREGTRIDRDDFVARLLASTEQEKEKLAGVLRRGLLQPLTALRLDVAWLLDHPADAQRLRGMTALLDESLALTQQVASDLLPLALVDFGLPSAMETVAARFTQHTGIGCVLETGNRLRIGPLRERGVLRLVQAWLSRVAQSPSAGVRIGLHEHGQDVVVTLEAQGAFEATTPADMSAWAGSIGGELQQKHDSEQESWTLRLHRRRGSNLDRPQEALAEP